MSKTVTGFSKCAIAAAVMGLGLAGPALAQTAGSTGPAGSSNAGVKTPTTGGTEVSPRPGPLPGKSTTSGIPDAPKTTSEAGDARPDEKTTRTTPPAGSASVPSPKTPQTVKEAGDARPLERQGATTGATGTGTRSDGSKDTKR